MIKDMKFHIYNFSHDPLCWELSEDDNDRAIEFDSEEEAKQCLELIRLYYPEFWGTIQNFLTLYLTKAFSCVILATQFDIGSRNS